MVFNVGDKVRIRGCKEDFTDELDGEIATIVFVSEKDCLVEFEPTVFMFQMWVWNHNMTLVEDK